MRITFVEHKLNLKTGGGSNHNIHHTALALTALGHEVAYLTVAPRLNAFPPDLPYRVIEEPLAEGHLRLRGKLALVAVLKRRQAETDIYQIESPSLLFSGALYRRLGGRTPVVGNLQTYTFFCSNVSKMDADCFRHCSLRDRLAHRPEPPARKLVRAPVRALEHYAEQRIINGVDRFIALTPAVAQIHSWYGIDARKMIVIPPPLDIPVLARQRRPVAHRATGRPYTIVYTGRLAWEKGVDLLLRAVAELDFAVTVDIVGEGIARRGLECLARELGLADRVTFHGWVSQHAIVDAYLDADLFVHPGRWPEPAGRTVMEAMALGVPLVVSDIGGPPWLAAGAALTFPPDDHRSLARQIATLYHQPDLAAALVTAGQQLAWQFDRQRIVGELVGVYRALCPGARVTSAGAAA